MKKLTSFIVLALMVCQFSLAADAPVGAKGGKKGPKLTTEQRKKMADAHEKMAACLRTDKPLGECHKEMMKACEDEMGKNACPMMGGHHEGGMQHGMEHDDSHS